MTQLSTKPQSDAEAEPFEAVGVGYWEIPSSLDKAAFEHETPEDEDAADDFVLQAFWKIHAQVHEAPSAPAAAHDTTGEGRSDSSS